MAHLHRREEVLKICSDFYQELYSSLAVNNLHEENISPENSEVSRITRQEVEVAIKRIKRIRHRGMMRSQETYSGKVAVRL